MIHLPQSAATRRKARAQDLETYAQDIVETVREPLLILDSALRVQSANRAFYHTFRVSANETENRLIYELGNGQWDIPALRTLLEDVIPASSVFNDFELEHTFPVIGRRTMLLNGRKLRAGSHAELLVLAMEDVTERRRAEADLKALETYAQDVVRDGARAPADPGSRPARPQRQPRLLPDVRGRRHGDGEPAHLRAGQRPVGHPGPAHPARGHHPHELRVQRLRAGARLSRHRPADHAAERAGSCAGRPRGPARPGHGGRHGAAPGRGGAQGPRDVRAGHRRHGARAAADPGPRPARAQSPTAPSTRRSTSRARRPRTT